MSNNITGKRDLKVDAHVADILERLLAGRKGETGTATPRDCKHGQLARSCEVCQLERELADARDIIAKFIANEEDGTTDRLERELAEARADAVKVQELFEASRMENAELRRRCEGCAVSLRKCMEYIDSIDTEPTLDNDVRNDALEALAESEIEAVGEATDGKDGVG